MRGAPLELADTAEIGELIDDGDDLVCSNRIGVGVVDYADPTCRSVATAVDDFPWNVGIVAHAPEEPRRRLPDRHLFVPAKKVELSEEDDECHERTRHHSRHQRAQQRAPWEHGQQAQEDGQE